MPLIMAFSMLDLTRFLERVGKHWVSEVNAHGIINGMDSGQSVDTAAAALPRRNTSCASAR